MFIIVGREVMLTVPGCKEELSAVTTTVPAAMVDCSITVDIPADATFTVVPASVP